MPWKPSDSKKHTHKADTPTRQRQWADVANSALKGGASEGSAVRQANAAVNKARRSGSGRKK
jgi:hypothetical protein